MTKHILFFQVKHENNINLWLNHLLVAFMFFISIAPNGYAIDFIFTLMMLLIAMRGNYITYMKISLSHPITKAFLLLMAVHYIWLYGTTDMNWANTTLKYSHYLLYPFFFFLFIDQRFFNRFLSSFIAGALLSESLSYLMQFHLIPWGYSINNIQLPWNEIGHKFKIIFYSAINNEPAPFLEHSWYSVSISLTAVIILYKAISNKTTILEKTIDFIFFITMSINLFFIGGRTGYVLYFILLFILLLKTYKKINSKKTTFLIILAPIVITIFMYNTGGLFQHRVDESVNVLQQINDKTYDMKTSVGKRLHLAECGLESIPKHFFFGVGTGDQQSYLRNNPDNKNHIIQTTRDVHNQYIDIFLQFGLVGFLFYLNLIYQVFKFKPNDEIKDTVKLLTIVAMSYTGFLASFWYFLPVFFTSLIIISTANKDIITTKIESSNLKLIFLYSSMILISYTVEKLQ